MFVNFMRCERIELIYSSNVRTFARVPRQVSTGHAVIAQQTDYIILKCVPRLSCGTLTVHDGGTSDET